ncbi:MAG: hypothetical protein LBQ22_00970 [Bacteroidales bacterium]|jgi:lipoate-protein ligase A|nr:hypothetical protein [Bacteroidales bacterium]
MFVLKSDSNEAYYNLALEEYLLNNYKEDFFIIDSNEPSIILGINQNAYEEINVLYAKKSSIKVGRRITGGGTIFQDQGNLNFSYIYKDDNSDLYDFKKISKIIADFLKEKLNLDITFTGYSHLLINGKKFGGYTKLRINDKILLHSTLVFKSNKKFLVDAYKLQQHRDYDRALRSTHEKVTSISAHLPETFSMSKFKESFFNYILEIFPDIQQFELSKEDNENIKELVKNKYSTWEWNYGKEIVANFSNRLSTKAGNVEICLQIEENVMKQVRIFGDFFSQKNIKDLEDALRNCVYEKNAIEKVISGYNLNDYLEMIDKDEFINCFFKN